MENTMSMAWEIARQAQSNHGGKVKEYFSEALKMAWSIVKAENKTKEVTTIKCYICGKKVDVESINMFGCADCQKAHDAKWDRIRKKRIEDNKLKKRLKWIATFNVAVPVVGILVSLL